MNRARALTSIATGALTVLFWLLAPSQIASQSLSAYVYELAPGFAVAALVTLVVSVSTKINKALIAMHRAMEHELQRQRQD